MFLHLSVSHSVHKGGTWAGTPRARTPPRRYIPHAGTKQPGIPLGRYTLRVGTPPRPQCMLGYGQQVGGKHPTGMHSCYLSLSRCAILLDLLMLVRCTY